MHRPMSYSIESGKLPDQDPTSNNLDSAEAPSHIACPFRYSGFLARFSLTVVTVTILHLVCLVGVTSLAQYDSRFEKEHWARRFPIIGMIQQWLSVSGPRGWYTLSLTEAQQVARAHKCEEADSGSETRRRRRMYRSYAVASGEAKSRAGITHKKTTRFAVLPSPDSISGDWYSASDAILQHHGP